MAEPRLLAIGRAVPQRRYTQHELLAHSPWGELPLLARLFEESPVRSRGLFVPPTFYRGGPGLTDTNQAWKEGALSLGGAALREALQGAGMQATGVDMIGVTTVTGYATPGLDLLLARQEGLRDDLARAHFNCVGCHAAVPLLKVAADHAARRPGSRAVALAVEICSACFTERPDPENLVAISLFADGAAAAVVSTEGQGPRILDFGAVYDLDHLDALGFGLTAEGFRIVLDPAIPARIGAAVTRAVDTLLARHGATRRDVGTWCFHPGGSRILDAVQRSLELPDEALRPSRRVLRAHGNMSSPSILFVLAEALRQPPPPGRLALLAAFGPGLGIETALLATDP